jgi:hypothetical protein
VKQCWRETGGESLVVVSEVWDQSKERNQSMLEITKRHIAPKVCWTLNFGLWKQRSGHFVLALEHTLRSILMHGSRQNKVLRLVYIVALDGLSPCISWRCVIGLFLERFNIPTADEQER